MDANSSSVLIHDEGSGLKADARVYEWSAADGDGLALASSPSPQSSLHSQRREPGPTDEPAPEPVGNSYSQGYERDAGPLQGANAPPIPWSLLKRPSPTQSMIMMQSNQRSPAHEQRLDSQHSQHTPVQRDVDVEWHEAVEQPRCRNHQIDSSVLMQHCSTTTSRKHGEVCIQKLSSVQWGQHSGPIRGQRPIPPMAPTSWSAIPGQMGQRAPLQHGQDGLWPQATMAVEQPRSRNHHFDSSAPIQRCMASASTTPYEEICTQEDISFQLKQHSGPLRLQRSMPPIGATNWGAMPPDMGHRSEQTQALREQEHSQEHCFAKFEELPSPQSPATISDSAQNLDAGMQVVHTIIIKNVPRTCSRHHVLDAIRSLGFGSSFNFCHLPLSRKKRQNLSYAFVGFHDTRVATQFIETINGYCFPGAERACEAEAARPAGNNVEFFDKASGWSGRKVKTTGAPWEGIQ